MRYHAYLKHLLLILIAAGMSDATFAAAFQIWEQDGATLGEYHAGRSASANDASTSFYNPAGMVRLKNQQVELGGIAVVPDIQFRGTVAVNTFHANAPQTVSAQGGTFAFIPNLNYVSPINDKLAFGFSIVVPFGLKVAYGHETALQYASTLDFVQVFDFTPSLAYRINHKLSMGLGLDMQKMSAEFDQVGVAGNNSNTDSTNKGWDTAYGYRLGALYEFNDKTRAGLAFNSQVVHHLSGNSIFMGPIAMVHNGGQPIQTTFTSANITLPAYTTLSLFHEIDPKWSVMGSVIYTQWDVFKKLVIQNVAGISPPGLGVASTQLVIRVPEYFRNTWNLAAGAHYQLNDKCMLRAGLGYDQTPTNNNYRSVQVPDGNRIAVAAGAHYQATKTVGFDFGWTHLFIQSSGGDSDINPPVQIAGSERVTTKGSLRSNADVFGAQVTWDML